MLDPRLDRALLLARGPHSTRGSAIPAGSGWSVHAWIGHSHWLGVLTPRWDRAFRPTRSPDITRGSAVPAGSEWSIHVWIGRFEPGRGDAPKKRRPSARG